MFKITWCHRVEPSLGYLHNDFPKRAKFLIEIFPNPNAPFIFGLHTTSQLTRWSLLPSPTPESFLFSYRVPIYSLPWVPFDNASSREWMECSMGSPPKSNFNPFKYHAISWSSVSFRFMTHELTKLLRIIFHILITSVMQLMKFAVKSLGII